ncbi:hypothetical protein M0802_009422 [Mischocyttarus mexicanus]|nr:hypothetical protein M0802_009422 [Mischocyttarus mexicanus]
MAKSMTKHFSKDLTPRGKESPVKMAAGQVGGVSGIRGLSVDAKYVVPQKRGRTHDEEVKAQGCKRYESQSLET